MTRCWGWIGPGHFGASLFGREHPVYPGGGVVSLAFPSGDLRGEKFAVVDATVEALSSQDGSPAETVSLQFFDDLPKPIVLHALGDQHRLQRAWILNCAGMTSSRSLTSSPIRCSPLPQHGQALSSISTIVSTRGRCAGREPRLT